MSYDKALETVDFLLEVLAEADKPAPTQESAPSVTKSKPVTKKEEAPKVEELKEEYYQSVEDEGIEEGKTVKVTVDSKRFEEMWAEAELGINDDKDMYLGAIGKIMEIEEDDDSVKVRWANYDTCWIPIKACVPSNGAEPTLPNGFLSHLSK